MLAGMLRRVLLFQAGMLCLFSITVTWLADLPWWVGLAIFVFFPMAVVWLWMVKITLHACQHRSSWTGMLRASLGEAFWVYRFFVLRLPWASDAPHLLPATSLPEGMGVVLVHGFVCNHRIWDDLAPYLRSRGHAVLALDLEPVFGSIDGYAAAIEQAARSLCLHTGKARVALVGHSMGGLAIRAWVRAYGTDRVAVAITLGTPHQGTQVSPHARAPNGKQMIWQSAWLAELSATEGPATGSLFRIAITPQDAIVFPQREQTLPGTPAHVFDGLGHVQLCSDTKVMHWVAEQLASARA
jgi:pimeloyl-ACP methyl ester carboxylesterase